MTGGPHGQRGDARTNRGEASVAAEPLTEARVTNETKAERRDGRPEETARSRMENPCAQHDGEDRPSRDGERAHADRCDSSHGDGSCRTRAINDEASGNLTG